MIIGRSFIMLIVKTYTIQMKSKIASLTIDNLAIIKNIFNKIQIRLIYDEDMYELDLEKVFVVHIIAYSIN